MRTDTEQKYNETLTARGFTIESSEAKAGESMLDYSITIKKDGREVITTDYHLGISHVDLKQTLTRMQRGGIFGGTKDPRSFNDSELSMFEAWKNKPYANFKDKALQMRVAVKLANWQKATPSLADALHSLLMDGQAYLQAQSFEDWACEYGYDIDSRKAESIYHKCDEIGRALARTLGADEIAKLEKLLQDL